MSIMITNLHEDSFWNVVNSCRMKYVCYLWSMEMNRFVLILPRQSQMFPSGGMERESPVNKWIVTSAEEGGYVFGSVCLSVCLFVCLSVGLLANLWTDFDEIFVGLGHGSRTKWYNVGGDPGHASDPGVQSPKSGSSGSVEVCALWVLLV